MARLIVAVLALMSVLTCPAFARPVSHEGGWTAMQMSDRQGTAGLVHYTTSPYLSIGYRLDWDRSADVLFNGAQLTWLAKRWFGREYQANLYFYGGAGVATGVRSNPSRSGIAAIGGVMTDWETQRWYLSYRAQVFDAVGHGSMVYQAARIGVAPYIGGTGDLHTWLMIEIDHRPDNSDEIGFTPLVRFFKGPTMLEAGWSLTDNKPLVNFAHRF